MSAKVKTIAATALLTIILTSSLNMKNDNSVTTSLPIPENLGIVQIADNNLNQQANLGIPEIVTPLELQPQIETPVIEHTVVSKLTPQEELATSVTVDKAPHVAIGQLVTIDENTTYYKTSEDALNDINPVRVGSIIYPGDYEVNHIAVLVANDNGRYSFVENFNRNISTEQLAQNNPNLKFAIHIKIPDAVGQVNDIGWINADQIKIVKDRGGIVNEYAVKHR